MSRLADLDHFYALLGRLDSRLGSVRHLKDCTGRMGWPERGVYFFFEDGETRDDGRTPRVVRVGTHALTATSRTTLWNRLSQHRGQAGGTHAGGGNHRGSVFRRHVGAALLAPDGPFGDAVPTWGKGASAAHEEVKAEYALECAVSQVIGAMPFLWLGVPDAPGGANDRGVLEANAIALLSNLGKAPIDPPSPRWLGCFADRAVIRESGLWNVHHVERAYDPAFLNLMDEYIEKA